MKILIPKVFLLLIYLPVNAEMMYNAEVIASSLNIRSIPSNEGRIIGSLFKGQQILVTPTSNEWVKTQLDGNEIGYISSIHLKMIYVILLYLLLKKLKKNYLKKKEDYQDKM